MIDGCDNKHLAKGYCCKHYSRIRNNGDPNITLRPRDRTCSVPGCERKHDAKGFCNKHYCQQPLQKERIRKYNSSDRCKKLKWARMQKAKFKKWLRCYWLRPKTQIRNRAYSRVRSAILSGKLIKKDCEWCSSDQGVQAHHDSYFYTDWLNVRWFCVKCHKLWHKLFSPLYPSKNGLDIVKSFAISWIESGAAKTPEEACDLALRTYHIHMTDVLSVLSAS